MTRISSDDAAWNLFQAATCKRLMYYFLFFASIFGHVHAAQFKALPGEEYLASSAINHIIQRQDGFIWMATAEGVSRYDGKNFVNHKSFPKNLNSLPNSWANWLLEDHNNHLWVATAGGLARLKSNEISFEQYVFSPDNPNSIAGNNIFHLYEDQQRRLWVATGMGLSLYQPASNDFHNYYINPNKADAEINNINVIMQKDADHLWIGNANGLFVFNINSGTFNPQKLAVEDANEIDVLDLAIDQQGHLWVVTAYDGAYKLNPNTEVVTTYKHQPNNPNSISSDDLWGITIDSNDHIWLSSWGDGISQIMTNDQIIRHQNILGDNRSIPSNFTTSVLEDNSGLIWVTTYNGVALHQPNNPVENIRPIPGQPDSLSSDMVWAFEESNDAIWIGTAEGINRWDKNKQTITPYFGRNKQNNNSEMISVWNITKANNNLFWLGTENGLAQFDLTTKSLKLAHQSITKTEDNKDLIKLSKEAAWVVDQQADGTLWVGTNDSSLYLIDPNFKVLKNHSEVIKSSLGKYEVVEFTSIIANEKHNMWLGTTNGLFYFNDQQSTFSAVRNTTGETLYDKDWVFSVRQHWHNQYWVASQLNGLALIEFRDDGTAKQLLKLDHSHPNIIDRSIYTVFPINEHEIWFTGKRNLYHLDFDSKVVTNYGSNYFESNITFHENSQFIAADGKLYIGSNHGMIKFDQNSLKQGKSNLNLYFTEISSNSLSVATHLNSTDFSLARSAHRSVELSTPIHKLTEFVFPYQDVIISFKFAALDFFNSENLHYAYRLPQLNNEWIDLFNRNEITLTNLEAGDYQIDIKATNAGFQWDENVTSMSFTLLPKPWFTWWAKLIYIILTAALAFTVVRFYRKHLLTQYALNHRETQLSQAIWGSGDELWEWNILKQEISRTNSAELNDDRIRKFSGSFAGSNLRIHPDDTANLQRKIDAILDGHSDEFDAVYRQKNNQGNWVWIQDRARVTSRNYSGEPLVINGISRNINSIKEKEQRSLLIASAFQSSSDGAVVLDADFKIISINAAFTAITGYDDRIINKFMPWRAGPISTDELPSSELFQLISQVVLKGGSYNDEVRISTVDGKLIPIDLRVNCIYNDKKEPSHYIATITDITYRKHTEEELKQLANYDSLTGLPNRSLMMIQLKKSLQLAEQKGNKMAVMFVDLDHFKNINDSLGHSIGDELLVAAARRLSKCIRKSDMVARIGGDEFTISLLNYDNISDVIKVAEKVLKKMAKPFQLTNHELIITPSIGIATLNGDNIDTETLLMQADTAMYHAKRSGRNNFQFYTESMNQAVLNRVETEMRLRKALKNKELVLYYQPKFNLNTGRITGFEALIRWHNEDEELIPPDDFIPIAEETGLISSIGKFVLDSACEQLHQWQKNGNKHVHIAINLSALQFMDKNLVAHVSQVLEKYNISPYSLELEITESTLIENLQYTIKTLHELRSLGVKLSLDDFGTGFSSLNYLKQFPIHALKIDRSFIKDIESDSRDASMVESIINLAHNLSIEVVAEGVETMEQLHLLKSFNIEEVQGFLLSKPFDVNAATTFLEHGHTVSGITNKIETPLAQQNQT